MAENITSLARSLKDFLTRSQDDSYNQRNAGRNENHKYNNLKIFMDKDRSQTPHFIIKVGISEAMFKVQDCTKIRGGLGPDEKFVYRWYDKPTIAEQLKKRWNEAE